MQPGQGRQSSPEKATAKAADRVENTLGHQKLQSLSHKPQDKPNGSCSHNCLTSSGLTLSSASLPPISPRHLPGDLSSQDTSHSLRATSLLWQPLPGSTGEKRCWKWPALPREKSYNALCLKILRQNQANISGQRELATGSCQTAVRRKGEGVFQSRGTDAAFLYHSQGWDFLQGRF